MSARNHHVTPGEITAIGNIATPGEFPEGIPFEFGRWEIDLPNGLSNLPGSPNSVPHFCRAGNIVQISHTSGYSIMGDTNVHEIGILPFPANPGTLEYFGSYIRPSGIHASLNRLRIPCFIEIGPGNPSNRLARLFLDLSFWTDTVLESPFPAGQNPFTIRVSNLRSLMSTKYPNIDPSDITFILHMHFLYINRQ